MGSVRSSAVLGLIVCCIELGFVQYSAQHGVLVELDSDSGEYEYLVFCKGRYMAVALPLTSLSPVKVFGMTPVQEVPKTCGYFLTVQRGRNILQISYTCCKAPLQNGICTLKIVYQNSKGQDEITTASCRVNSVQAPSLMISPTPEPLNPVFLQPTSPPQPNVLPSPTPGVPLHPASVTLFSPSSIPWPSQKQGCSADGKFVFAIPANITDPPLNTFGLTVAGQDGCKPAVVNEDIAFFNFSVTECGTRFYRVGKTLIYLAEVHTAIKTLNFKYGIITRDHPVRVMIECRYSKIGLCPLTGQATGWTTAGYMVMSTSLPALVRAKGLFGVQLRIAEDKTFSTFLPHDHQPLRVLLGKPVYLEVRLISPKPKATLLVHYCLAYPRTSKSALVLLYEGCPNPLDADNISILHMADLPQNRHQRRFEVKAFQFMDQSTNRYLNEEIYFMCSTEVCMPSQTPCKETCFDVKSP